MSELSTTIVITTLDRPDDVKECIHSVEAQTRTPDQVVIVDGGDIENTKSNLPESDIPTVCVQGPGDGLPAARNQAIEHAEGDIVCFIDDDVILPPNWLAEILEVYETEDVDGVGGSVVNYTPESIEKGNMASPFYRFVTAVRTMFFHNRIGEIGPIGVLYAPMTFIGTHRMDVDSFQGCNMTFRAEVFEDTQFDEWYGVGGSAPLEEVDFCSRLGNQGRRLVYTPRATVIHKRTELGGERNENTKSDFRSLRNSVFYSLNQSSHLTENLIVLSLILIRTLVMSRSVKPIRAVYEGYEESRRRP